MTAQSILQKFDQVFSKWENALDDYSEADFLRRPTPDSWSIGQVYVHLINSVLGFHARQVEACLANDDHVNASKKGPGKIIYLINGFLPVKVKVPPSETYTPKPPAGKEEVKKGLALVKSKMKDLAPKVDASASMGKTEHPALGYLNALEWYQLIEMHYRHHLRQKGRIDQFLKTAPLL